MTFIEGLELAGVVIAVLALIFTAINVNLSRKIAMAQFWLSLRDQFSHHNAIHQRLRHGGDWAGNNGKPQNSSEWSDLEAYMGLFEHCEAMLKQGLIDEKTFEGIYCYRVKNILSNPIIVQEKLVNRRDGWLAFHELIKRFHLEKLLRT